MKQKFLIFSTLILSLFFTACIFSPSIKGNGNVVQQTRSLHDFDAIKVSRGMNVYISQGNATRVIVKADENLLKVIETEVSNGVLKISCEANIRKAKSKKVYITTPNLEIIETSSGSNVFSETLLEFDELEVSASSGSNINLTLKSESTTASASSGSNIKLEGKTKSLNAKASSGSNIKAGNLKSANCKAKVSSGANIWMMANKSLSGNASSGGNVFYYGNPDNTDIHRSSGGNVIKKDS